jgi:hypothetical protein
MKQLYIWILSLVLLICLGIGIWVMGLSLVGCGSSGGDLDQITTTAAPTTTLGNTTTTSGSATTTTSRRTTTTSPVVTTTTHSTTTTIFTGPTYSISGKVLFASTSDPVKGGVAVEASGIFVDSRQATADVNTGNFTISGCQPGTYLISGTKNGWTINQLSVSVSNTDLTGKNLTATPAKWQIMHVGGGNTINAIDNLTSIETIVAAGNLGSIMLKASTPFTSWTSMTSPTSEPLVNVSGKDGFTVITRSARMFNSTNEGDSWIADYSFMGFVSPLTNEAISDVALTGFGGQMVYVTETGKVVKRPISTPFTGVTPPGAFIKGFVRDSLSVISMRVVGNNGAAYKTTNGGSTWTALGTFPPSATLESLSQGYLGGENKGIVLSLNGTIYVTLDGGATWTEDLSGIPYPLSGINMLDSGTFVIGGNGLIMQQLYW